MRFRVPNFWWILKNAFFDVDPQAENGRLQSEFDQDILTMHRVLPVMGGSNEPDYILDLGWYPDEDPSGTYRLRLAGSGWDDMLATVESRDRRVIRDTMERWTSQIDRARDREQLLRWLSKDA